MTADCALVNASAPIRICDNGGWTDTWFARHGRIFNIAVSPRVHVQVRTSPRRPNAPPYTLQAANFSGHLGARYAPTPSPGQRWERHPLLEATVAYVGLPKRLTADIYIHSAAPPGASTGTSAAVCVALIAALDALTPGRLTPPEIAAAAWSVETDMLGQQCGIQDQLCAAHGGINLIRMDTYPHAAVTRIQLSPTLHWELERRLALVYLGKAHHSSRVHEAVIAGLEAAGAAAPSLEALRQFARPSAAAVAAGNWATLGSAMRANTEAQRQLHPALVSAAAERVIEIAAAHGALGWKVNGAGGSGGSVTLLCGDLAADKGALLAEITAALPESQIIPIALSGDGVRVWLN